MRVIEPPVIAATQPLLLDPPPLERGAAVRAMRLERTHMPLFVAELTRRADRLPIAAEEFAHRAARLDAGQLIIR